MKTELALGAVLVGVGLAYGFTMDFQPKTKQPTAGIIEPCIWPKCSRPIISQEWVINLN